MTPAQHADRFVANNVGVYIDEDRSYGSQCWDVVAKYARVEYGCPSFPTVSGGAEGLYRIFAYPIPNFFDKVSRDDLRKGDIVVWSADFYPPFGHTAVVWSREGNTIFVLEQDGSKDPNGDGKADGVSYIAQRTITNKVAGGLRPKGGDTMSTVGEVELNYLYRAFFGPMERNPVTDGDRKRWIGAETNTVIRQMEADPRHANYHSNYIGDLEKAVQAPSPKPAETFVPYSGPALYNKK